MIDLKCKCTTCKNNSNCNCNAQGITVTKGTICSGFRAKRVSNVEFADEIVQPLVRPSTEVECYARCMFNKDGICVANGITVGDLNSNASCETFLPE